MLKSFFFLLILFTATYLHAQTYSFDKLEKKVRVETPNGDDVRVLNSQTGNFRLVFEKPTSPRSKKLFTVLKPGQSNGAGLSWYGYLEPKGYKNKNGRTYETASYYDTANDDVVIVFIESNFSEVLIFQSDGAYLEFTKSDIKKNSFGGQHFEKLIVDKKTGIYKVKYTLESFSDVTINMIDVNDNEVVSNNYNGKKPGVYLQTIDMRTLPIGSYLVVIKAGNVILNRYRVDKK